EFALSLNLTFPGRFPRATCGPLAGVACAVPVAATPLPAPVHRLSQAGPVAGAQPVEIRRHLVVDGGVGQADAIDAPGTAAKPQRPQGVSYGAQWAQGAVGDQRLAAAGKAGDDGAVVHLAVSV